MRTASLLLPLALATTLPAQPIARVVITPGAPEVSAGDSIRLTAQALDANGTPIPSARMRFVAAGGLFMGRVDPSGLVTTGIVGTIPVTVIASVGDAAPTMQRVEVRVRPGAPARLALVAPPAKLLVGQTVRLRADAFSTANDPRPDVTPSWTVDAPRFATLDGDALTARAAGRVTVTAAVGAVRATHTFDIIADRVRSLAIDAPRREARQGDVLRFTARVTDLAGRPVTGLSPAWAITPGDGRIDDDGSFVAYRPGTYTVTALLGGHRAEVALRITPRDVRRATEVVGQLVRSAFFTSEVWVHPDGTHAYLGTTHGGDRIYAIDVRNPARPIVTDSIMANSRSMNDVMSTADGKWLVFTREGASDRKNGIVIASLADPAHPTVVSEFTDGVSAGVHSAFVNTQAKYGTHVYLTNNGTGEFTVIDITDPLAPRRVATWKPRENRAARALHDIDVQDGIAYVSYWGDGLILLDVGNGLKGGRPDAPQLIGQYKYDISAQYVDAQARYGPGFITGTHTAWKHGRYVFISDEVFPPTAGPQGWDLANIQAYGNLQVIDVSDPTAPKPVAYYEPEYGGVHNVWAAGDTLYVGAYNGGVHVFDIGGELKGDLRAQGREIAHMMPSSPNGIVPGKTFTWGVVVKDGLMFVNDMMSGLWIMRLAPKPAPSP
ncbi:MAG: hypothetical protein MUE41_05280 [Gemmatimonadaceae bacterium]|jgi:hypothetical protein|nr:hypothetical protein [Gemmatimonadaceae bacterium]